MVYSFTGGSTSLTIQSQHPTLKKQRRFYKELIVYFPLIRHGLHRKRRLQKFFIVVGTSLPSCYLVTIGGYTDRPTDSSYIRHGPHRKRCLQQFFIVVGMSLPSCYVATIAGYTDKPRDSLIRNGPHGRWCVQQFFYCCVYSLPRERAYRAFA
jgi:hypothetical protein